MLHFLHMDQAYPLPDVDRATLTDVLQRALRRDVTHVGDWQDMPLSGGWEAATSIHRITGQAHIDSTTTPWTLVLKIVRAIPERDAPEHWNYWRREPLLYESGLLDDLPGGITAPQCYDVETRPDGSIWIWLESLTNVTDRDDESPWSLTTYGEVARQFGRFNGAYLTGRPLPNALGVSHSWLRNYIEAYAPVIEKLPELRDDPLVSRAVPERLAHDLLRVNSERGRLLSALDRLPQTFCHLDGWRPNLFVTSDTNGPPRITAVDWAFSGIAAVGQELAPIVFSNMDDPAMEETVLTQYLKGLHDAGCRGKDWQVKLGYTAALVLEYTLGGMGFIVNAIVDDRERDYWTLHDEPREQVVERLADLVAFPMSRVDQALGLLAEL